MSSTPPPQHTPPPLHYPNSGKRVGHRLHPIVIAAIIAVVILIAAAVTAAIVMNGNAHRPKPPPMLPHAQATATAPAKPGTPRPPDLARTPTTARNVQIRLTSSDPIGIAQGISITPAPGWTLGTRGPDWVILYNADSTAQVYVAVKSTSGTNVVAALQQDINQLSSTAAGGLGSTALGKVQTKTLQSANFQQQASIAYIAEVSTQQGTAPIIGVFSELLNTSNQLSAFIDFRQTSDASDQAADASGIMIHSML